MQSVPCSASSRHGWLHGGSEVARRRAAGTRASALDGRGSLLPQSPSAGLRVGSRTRAGGNRRRPERTPRARPVPTSSRLFSEEALDGGAVRRSCSSSFALVHEELGLNAETFLTRSLHVLGDRVDRHRRVHSIIPFFSTVGMPAVLARSSSAPSPTSWSARRALVTTHRGGQRRGK